MPRRRARPERSEIERQAVGGERGIVRPYLLVEGPRFSGMLQAAWTLGRVVTQISLRWGSDRWAAICRTAET